MVGVRGEVRFRVRVGVGIRVENDIKRLVV